MVKERECYSDHMCTKPVWVTKAIRGVLSSHPEGLMLSNRLVW
jgi:hypothetical protein